MLNGIKGLSTVLARCGEDALSAELRSAVHKIYRVRTGSAHGNLAAWWADAFEQSEARMSASALASARASGAALSYEELVDRAIEIAAEVRSARVDELA